MGLLSIIRKQKIKDKELRVLVLGLDNAGKTTIIKHILHQDIKQVSPTMGFQIETILHNGYTLNVWDIGGQKSLRVFWGNYFDKTNVVVWVIDALAPERISESIAELREKIIARDRLGRGVKLLVAINKVDLVPEPQSLRMQVIKILDSELSALDNWRVELVSGRSGIGLTLVLDYLTSTDG